MYHRIDLSGYTPGIMPVSNVISTTPIVFINGERDGGRGGGSKVLIFISLNRILSSQDVITTYRRHSS